MSVDQGAPAKLPGRWKSHIGIAIDAAGNALSDNAAADVIAHLVLPSTPEPTNTDQALYASAVVRPCVARETEREREREREKMGSLSNVQKRPAAGLL